MTKDQNQDPDVVRSKDIPVTKGMFDELRAEMQSGFLKIEHQFKGVDYKFIGIDKRFDEVDKRFDAMDKRFDAMDKRFDAMDKKFDAIDKKFDEVDKRFDEVDKRFDEVDKRFDRVDAQFDEVKAMIRASIEHTNKLFHEIKVIAEDQAAQNRFALDAYNMVNYRLDGHEARIKTLEEGT